MAMEQKIDEILRIDPTLIDARLRTMLYKIPEERALHILTDFQKALLNNRDSIRNPVAYLMGMAQRVLSAKEMPESSRVKRELDRLFREGRISPSDIDERCRDMLKHLPEEKAIEALHELEVTDVSTLHNIAAFFMGIMKKHTRATTAPKSSTSSIASDPFRLGGSEHSLVEPSSARAPFVLQDLPPAPRVMPSDLSYGYGEQEYVPEMPKTSVNMSFLPFSVQTALQNILNQGILIPDDLDDRILLELKGYPEEHALAIAREFLSVDRLSIRNVPSYLVGISRRVPFAGKPHHDERFPAKRPYEYHGMDDGRPRGVGPGPGPPPPHYSDRDRDYHDRDYHDRDSRYPPPHAPPPQQYHDRFPPPSASRYPPERYPPPPSHAAPLPDRFAPPHHPPPDRYAPPPLPDRYGAPPPRDRYPLPADRYLPPPHQAPVSRFPPGPPPGYPPPIDDPRDPHRRSIGYDDRGLDPRRGFDDRGMDDPRDPHRRAVGYDDRGLDPRRGYDDRGMVDPRAYRREPPPPSYPPSMPVHSPYDAPAMRDPRDYRPPESGPRNIVDVEISRNVAAGLIREEDIDERVRDYLAAQPPWISTKAIHEFCAKDMSRINNKSNFLKGIVRKILEKEAELASGGRSPPREFVGGNHSLGPMAMGGRNY